MALPLLHRPTQIRSAGIKFLQVLGRKCTGGFIILVDRAGRVELQTLYAVQPGKPDDFVQRNHEERNARNGCKCHRNPSERH